MQHHVGIAERGIDGIVRQAKLGFHARQAREGRLVTAVDRHHAPSGLPQEADQVRADEACGPCHDYRHRILPPSVPDRADGAIKAEAPPSRATSPCPY